MLLKFKLAALHSCNLTDVNWFTYCVLNHDTNLPRGTFVSPRREFLSPWLHCRKKPATISNNSNLDEVYSSSKNGWITLWAEPIQQKDVKSATRKTASKRTHSETLADGSDEGRRAYNYFKYLF